MDSGTVGVKCGATADEADGWRQRYPEHIAMSDYIGRYGWNKVSFDGIPADDVRELLDRSYEEIVAKLPKSKRP
jgi:predicted DNA-binding protein (MmcQ/YjbR family)